MKQLRRWRAAVCAATAMVVMAGFVHVGQRQAVAAPGASVPDTAGGADLSAITETDALAKAKLRKQPVEVLGERTASSQTFMRPDGKLTTTQYLRPRWVRRGEHRWVEADPTLRLEPDGSVRPVASTADMVFSGGGNSRFASMSMSGKSLGLTWPGVLPVPVLDGNTATYPEVLPGVDLKIIADVDGFVHLVVVKTAQAARASNVRRLRLGTEMVGLSLRVQPDSGVVQAVADDGTVFFDGPTPTMWDSSQDLTPVGGKSGGVPPAGHDPGFEAVGPQDVDAAVKALEPRSAKVRAEAAAGALTLIPDSTMLAEPGLVFPVYIDPTWTKVYGARNAWTLLRKSFPTSSHWNRVEGAGTTSDASDEINKGIVRAGYSYDSKRTYTDRSLFNMDISAAKYKTINKATFSITQAWSWWNDCAMGSPPITDLRVVGGFNSGTTWNNQPPLGAVVASVAKIRKYGLSCGPQPVDFDVTSRVRELAGVGAESMDLALVSRNDNGVVGNWARFRLNTLSLTVEYNTNPNAPTGLTVDGKACATGTSRPYVRTATPVFKANASDQDSVQSLLTTRYYWWLSTGSRGNDYVSATSNNPGAVNNVSIPSAKALADHTTYKYQAATLDDVGGITWSGVCEFRTLLNPPGQPASVTSAAYPADGGPSDMGSGGVGIAGSFTIQPPSAGHPEIVGFAYTLDIDVAPGAAPFVNAVGGVSAVVQVSPKRPGLNTLRVWTKDVAGQFSAVRTYGFKVRDGNGPAGQWLFPSTGSGADDTGHGNTLTLSGGATTAAGRANVGTALELNGTTAYAGRAGLSQPHPDTGAALTVQTSSSFAVAAWVKLDATGGSGIRAAVSAPGTNSSAFVLGYSGTANKWVFQMSGSDVASPATTSVLSDVTPVAGRWTHLVGTYDVATKRLRLHVMGAEQAPAMTTILSGSGFNAGQFEVGRHKTAGSATGYFDGRIDDVRMYAYVPPVSEFSSTLQPLPPVLSFPNGNQVVSGGSLAVTFDAAGDTNVVSFKYSTGTAGLGQSVAASTPGGTATVNIPVTQVGSLAVYAATIDLGNRQSPPANASATVVAAPKLSGVVYNGIDLSPVAGATVMLDPAGLQVTTAADGSYTITGFSAGTYTLAAYLNGPCGMSSATRIAVSEAVTHDIFLTAMKDGFGHECMTNPGTPFVPAAGSQLSLTGDDAVAQVSLPFAFPFYDGVFTSAWVDTNGILTFSDPAGAHPGRERNIPAPAEPNNLIAGYWDDLVVDASASLWVDHIGDPGISEFVIEWRNVHLKGDPAARLTFQIRLAEYGWVFINYSGLDTPTEQGQTAIVGIESPGGGMGIQYSYRQSQLANDSMVVFIRPLDATPIETYTVGGVVTDQSTGLPVAGVQVVLEPTDRTAVTDANGGYSFTDLEAGSYHVSTATAPFCGKYAGAHLDLVAAAQVDLQVQPLADAYGNTCLGGPQAFAPVSQQLTLTGDDQFQPVALPFPVGFYGQGYNTVWVDTNGLATFAAPAESAHTASEIPSSTQSPNGAVYALWDDWWVDASASVWTGLSGTAPNRRFAVEWRNVRHYDDANARVSFQLVFHENGDIAVAWADIDGASQFERGDLAVVGIENAAGTEALAYSMFQPVLASGQGVLFRPGTQIGATGGIGGTVTCQGVAAEGVVVAIPGHSTTTAADGSWLLTDIPIGSYSVLSIAESGACAGSTISTASVVGGSTSTVNIALAPVSGYSVVGGPRGFEPVDQQLALSGDDASTGVAVPFPVVVHGRSYVTGWVDTNGVVSFIQPSTPSYDVSPIPSVAANYRPNAAVYPFWSDWIVDASASVWTGASGTAPHRRFVIEWRNVRHYSDGGARVSFQVVFHESGDIAFAWSDIDPNVVEQGGQAVVGVENHDGTVAVSYSSLAQNLRGGQGLLLRPASPPALTGTLQGTATCAAAPAASASVKVAGLTATAAANGTWQLTGVPVGTHTLVSTSGDPACAGSTPTQVTVVGGASTTVNVQLAATGYDITVGNLPFEAAPDLVALTGDEAFTQVTLPFPVVLYGQTYTSAWIDINGFVSFTNPVSSSPVGTIPSAETNLPNAAVYALWDDWMVVDAGSSVLTGVSGAAPHRKFTVEWRNVQSFADPDRRASFQLVFEEAGDISIRWGTLGSGYAELGGFAVVGLENADGTAAIGYSQFATALRSGQSVTFTRRQP